MDPSYDKTFQLDSIKCQTPPYSLATQLMLFFNQFSDVFLFLATSDAR